MFRRNCNQENNTVHEKLFQALTLTYKQEINHMQIPSQKNAILAAESDTNELKQTCCAFIEAAFLNHTGLIYVLFVFQKK